MGWQTGVFQGKPRDPWLGWAKPLPCQRLPLIGHPTRFLILPAAQGGRNLGSSGLGANLPRLRADWQAEWGHPLERAESFVDPSRFKGTVSQAAHGLEVGRSRGYARSNGPSTDTLGLAKTRLVDPLRPDARARLRASAAPPEWRRRPRLVSDEAAAWLSLLEWLKEGPDPRHGPALRDRLSAVLAWLVRAKVAGRQGGRPPEAFAKALLPNELELWGCPCNRRTQRYEAPSDTTFQRVLARVEPSALERVVPRWIAPRCQRPQALAGNGKRIRGANRLSSEDDPWETVARVDPRSGLPVASRRYQEAGGEPAARRGLFEEVDLQGIPVTLDAGHTSRETLLALQEQPGADTLATSKGHAGWAYSLIAQDGHGAGPEARRTAGAGRPGTDIGSAANSSRRPRGGTPGCRGRGGGRGSGSRLAPSKSSRARSPPQGCPGSRVSVRSRLRRDGCCRGTGATGRARTGTLSRGTCRWAKTQAPAGPGTGGRTTRR